MSIGQKKQRITIERYKTTGYDDWNQPINEWTDHKTLWADVHPLAGREYWAARAVNAEVEGRIKIRHFTDILYSDRIKFGSRILDILYFFHPKEDKRSTEILYKEQQPANNTVEVEEGGG